MAAKYDTDTVSQRLRERGASDRAHTMALELLNRGFGIGDVVQAANRVHADEGRPPIELSGLLARKPPSAVVAALSESASDRVLAAMFGGNDILRDATFNPRGEAPSPIAAQILAVRFGQAPQ